MHNDLRFALRMIRSHAWFSAAIVVTLALGIGINTTVFTLVNAVLFKPVPIPGGERLVRILNQNTKDPGNFSPVSYPDFLEARKQSKALSNLEAVSQGQAILSEAGNPPAQHRLARISAGLLPMVRTFPVLGRTFTDADAAAGAEKVALLSHRVWQGRYGAAPNVVGRSVRLNGQPTTIIGVMPEGFLFPNGQDVWIPLTPDAELEKRSNRSLMLFGLLAPGASLASAGADLAVISRQLERAYPDTNKDAAFLAQTFHQAYNGGNIRTVFLLMLGAVAFVLLIACANVSNMMLSRALARRRENSIRAALGATRWQLVRQLLVESVLLSFMGGLIGLAISQVAVHYFDLATLAERPYWIIFSMDYVAYAYFAAISVLAGITFGVLPALRASRVDLATELKEGTRNMVAAAGGRSGRLAGTLVILQFALTMILLSGAGLMMRSFFKAQTINPFVPASGILSARINLPEEKGGKYAEKSERVRFFEELERRLTALPGVASAALSSSLPGSGSNVDRIEVEGSPLPADATSATAPRAAWVVGTPSYLSVIGLALQEGRGFDQRDGEDAREVAIVTRQFATRFWQNQAAIGKRFRFAEREKGKPGPWMQVIGISNDMLQNPQQSDSDERPLFFIPYRQEGWGGMAILVRTRGDAASTTALAVPLKTLVQELDQDLPVFDVNVLSTALERSRWHLSVFGSLFLSFATIGLLIASVGIYAVGAQTAASRTREIGIRMALGATTRDILAVMLSRGIVYLGAGLSLGLAGAVAVTGFMKGMLMQVSPHDPVVLSGVAATLAVIGAFACWLPARRAAALHPVHALREE